MPRREMRDFESMSSTELRSFHERMLRRILILNVLWLLFVIIVMVQSLNIGLILLVMTALKYWYDYTDTEALTIHDAVLTLLARTLSKGDGGGGN